MRKVFVTLLCLVMVAVFLPTMTFAATTHPVANAAELTAAFENAEDGDTIKLNADIDMNAGVTVKDGKDIVLDLNGYNIKGADIATLFHVQNGNLQVTGSGKIAAVNEVFRLIGNVNTGGEAIEAALTVGKDVSVESAEDCSVYMRGKGVEADIYGKLLSKGQYAAIQGNGTVNATNDYGNTVVRIHEGASVLSENSLGIYQPQSGELSVDGTVSGLTAIEIRAGKITVGPTAIITATAEAYESEPNGNGSASLGGAAIAVIQHNTRLPIEVVINGGQMTGPAALIAENTQDGEATDVKLDVLGGAFDGEVKSVNGGGEVKIEGGAFTALDKESVTITGDAAATLTAPGEKIEVIGSLYINASLAALEEELSAEEMALIKLEITKAEADVSFEVPAGITVRNATGGQITVNDSKVEANEEVKIETETPKPPAEEENPPVEEEKPPVQQPEDDPEKEDVPKMGDETTLLPWLAVMVMTAGAAVLLKRRENQ